MSDWKPTPGRDAMTRDGQRVTQIRAHATTPGHGFDDLQGFDKDGVLLMWDEFGRHCGGNHCPLDLVADADPLPATGPVRERTVRDIVPGVYGRVGVSSPYDGKVRVHFVAPDYVTAQLGAELTATELTDAIATLTAIRDAMEDKP